MNIAELFVRIRGDTTDLNRKLSEADRALLKTEATTGRLGKTMGAAGLQTGRLGNQFAGLAGQIAHVHPVVGNLAGVLGNFAIGSGLTVGVLAGVAAIAVVYERLTKAAREAKEANDKLVKSLEDANFRSSLGPDPDLVLQTNAMRNQLMQQRERRRVLLAYGTDPKDERILDLNVQILHSQTQLRIGEEKLFAARMAAGKGLVTVEVQGESRRTKAIAQVKELAFSFERLRKSAEEFWGPMNRFNEAFALPDLIDPMTLGPVDISDSVKIANDQAKKINDEAARHAQMIQDAIYQSARIISDSVMSALNIGGGGKGSQIGSQIGMAAGSIGGSFLGPPGAWFGGAVGSILGSTVGSIAGSFIGGLFDHKKAVEQNTNATRALTAAMILNSPSGFKINQRRYEATIPELGRDMRRHASRGGVNPLLVGT